MQAEAAGAAGDDGDFAGEGEDGGEGVEGDFCLGGGGHCGDGKGVGEEDDGMGWDGMRW